MEYRKLGGSGFKVPALTFGTGTFGGKAYTLTLANDGLKIVWNPGVEVPADVKAAAEKAIQGVKDGTVKALP